MIETDGAASTMDNGALGKVTGIFCNRISICSSIGLVLTGSSTGKDVDGVNCLSGTDLRGGIAWIGSTSFEGASFGLGRIGSTSSRLGSYNGGDGIKSTSIHSTFGDGRLSKGGWFICRSTSTLVGAKVEEGKACNGATD